MFIPILKIYIKPEIHLIIEIKKKIKNGKPVRNEEELEKLEKDNKIFAIVYERSKKMPVWDIWPFVAETSEGKIVLTQKGQEYTDNLLKNSKKIW